MLGYLQNIRKSHRELKKVYTMSEAVTSQFSANLNLASATTVTKKTFRENF